MTIKVSAPGKLMLLGEHAVVYNRPCLVTAVDYRVFAEVSVSENDIFEFPKGNGDHFVRTTLSLFREQFNCSYRFKIKTWSEYDQSYGLGSSSAVTVSVVKGLAELCAIKLSRKELFDICYKTILKVQGVGSGFDIAAAVYGGTLYFVTKGRKIEPIGSDPAEHASSISLVVGYTGVKGNTPTIVKDLAKRKEKNPAMFDDIFNTIAELVSQGKICLENQDWQSFGDLMRINHGLLVQLGVSTDMLDDLCTTALSAGACGAKLSGAGGGDCMIALVSDKTKQPVEQAIVAAGGELINIKAGAPGVQLESCQR